MGTRYTNRLVIATAHAFSATVNADADVNAGVRHWLRILNGRHEAHGCDHQQRRRRRCFINQNCRAAPKSACANC
ncbi:uncharacterized protein Dvir_GJ26260 [Drosophila virilis]|uniref:Uncharacterized protein n=1 Tax=Drosophila virilis TaxID=7244 RepID=A0A0Q9WTM0_DROVI|nr:uncharacterized protein Dvir_GJ26260 [Drosophila virilis]